MQVPGWWIGITAVYFVLSIIWTAALVIALVVVYQKVMPLVQEVRTQVRKVSGQAKSMAGHAAHTVDVVHAQTQRLLGSAESAGGIATRQARAVGATVTGVLVAARVVNFVRRIF